MVMISADDFKAFKERMEKEISRSKQKARKWENPEGPSSGRLAGWYDGFGDGIDYMLEVMEFEFVVR